MSTSKWSRILYKDLTPELEALRSEEGTAWMPHSVKVERSGRYGFRDRRARLEPFAGRSLRCDWTLPIEHARLERSSHTFSQRSLRGHDVDKRSNPRQSIGKVQCHGRDSRRALRRISHRSRRALRGVHPLFEVELPFWDRRRHQPGGGEQRLQGRRLVRRRQLQANRLRDGNSRRDHLLQHASGMWEGDHRRRPRHRAGVGAQVHVRRGCPRQPSADV